MLLRNVLAFGERAHRLVEDDVGADASQADGVARRSPATHLHVSTISCSESRDRDAYLLIVHGCHETCTCCVKAMVASSLESSP